MLFGKIPLPEWFTNFYNENKRGFLLLYVLLFLMFVHFVIFPVKKKPIQNPESQNISQVQKPQTSPTNSEQQPVNKVASEQNQNTPAVDTTKQVEIQPQPLTSEATSPSNNNNIATKTTSENSGLLTSNTNDKMKISMVVNEMYMEKVDPYRPLISEKEPVAPPITSSTKVTKFTKKIKVKPPKYNGYLPPLEIPLPKLQPTPVLVEVQKPATIKATGVAMDSQPSAIISDGNKDYIVKEGGTVAGYKIVSISTDKIILVKKGKRKEIKVGVN